CAPPSGRGARQSTRSGLPTMDALPSPGTQGRYMGRAVTPHSPSASATMRRALVAARMQRKEVDMTSTTARLTSQQARRIGAEIGIDWTTSPFDADQFRMGLEV